MTVRRLVGRSDPVLRGEAVPTFWEPVTPPAVIAQLITDLHDTCRHHDGAGLAAPQIGVPLRVCVVQCDGLWLALVDPVVRKTGRLTSTAYEGCLSLPGVQVRITRPRQLIVVSRGGPDVGTFNLTGLAARCALHELDHLDGILITDRRVARDEDTSSELGPVNPLPWLPLPDPLA